MRHSNNTANQHFVSQLEQRLNSCNPNASPQNQRIYSFTLVERETFSLSLDSLRGRLISNNLSLRDLFSFDVLNNSSRFNFESLFQQYEAGIKTNTIALLQKLDRGIGDIKKEILDLFVSKFMNFLRNPHSVNKILNTIGGVLLYHPTDTELLAEYNAVLAGRKPHQAKLCAQIGISPEQYQMWLRALFMMLIRSAPNELNIMEDAIKDLFEDPSSFPMVCVYSYSGEHANKRCLLSDRGYASPLPDDQHLSFSFNLCSTAFIVYIFASIEKLNLSYVPSAKLIDLYKMQTKNVRVVRFTNDLPALTRYNQNVVYQCHHAVYSSSPQVFGVTLQ